MFLYLSEQNPDNSFDSIQPKGYIGLETSVRDSTSPYRKFLPTDPNGLTVDNWQFKVRLTDIYDIPVTLLVRTRS